jgi:hypothetical protein
MKGTPSTRELYSADGFMIEHLPAKSADLSPVENSGHGCEKTFCNKNPEDMRSKRPVPSQDERRVLQVCESKKAKRVARSCFLGLSAVCRKAW